MRHVIFRALFAAGLSLVTAAPAWAGLEDGLAAYSRRDYATALESFRPLAEQGAAVAQYTLGNMYFVGQGLARDYTEAVRWYRLAARQEHAAAQYNLGLMYRNAWGVPRDNVEAVKWWRLSAELGRADAQYKLGNMYYAGQGVARSTTEAVKWWRMSAKQGDTDAQQKLSRIHYETQPEARFRWDEKGVMEMASDPSEWFGLVMNFIIGFGETMTIGDVLAIAAVVLIIVIPVVLPFSFFRIKPLMQTLADASAARDRSMLEEFSKIAPLLRQIAESSAERDQALLEEFRKINRALDGEVRRQEKTAAGKPGTA